MSLASVQYDPFSAQMHDDPYPTYRWLREHDPVHYSPLRDLWAISRHDDVVAVTGDWATFSSAGGADTDGLGTYFEAPGSFLDTDPELHGALRSVLHRSFMPKALKDRVGPIVHDAIADRLDALAEIEVADFAREFAWAVPARVTADLLGLPREDVPRVQRWVEEVMRRIADVPVPPPAALDALAEVAAYLRGMLASRHGAQGEELLDVIANATVDGAAIGDAAVGMASLVFIAGVETSASLIGNSLLLLAQHPDQRAWLARHPKAVPAAVEEILRFECPAQHIRRVTTREVEMHDKLIPADAYVVVIYGSANRDERRYEDPERFDVRRNPMRSLAFGNGIHHCIGAPLARLLGAAVLEAILRELPDYEMAGPVERFCNHMDRGIQTLPLRQNRR